MSNIELEFGFLWFSVFVCYLCSLLNSCFIFTEYIYIFLNVWVGPMHIQRCHRKLIYQNQKSMFLCIRTRSALFFNNSLYFLVFFHNVYFSLKKRVWKELPDLSWNFHFKFKTDSQTSTGIYLQIRQRLCTCDCLNWPKNGTIASHKCCHRYFLFGYRILSEIPWLGGEFYLSCRSTSCL